MTPVPKIHIAVMQPSGYVHALGFIDQARYLRFQMRRLGAEVTIAKNRLREDAVNFVFGAHLGFAAELQQRHACIFFNLEQLGQGGAAVNPQYVQLLRHAAVVDYDVDNVGAYASDAADIPIVPFHYAPYLAGQATLPLEQRPIDLLFFGSMNERRKRWIERIEAAGVQVAMFDHALYGDERDHYIQQAKAVLNCHFYEASRFEQVRVSHCLSLGTPVISERAAQTRPDAVFEQAVTWLDEGEVETFFKNSFARPSYFQQARAQLDRFSQTDPVEAYADLLAFAAGYMQGHGRIRAAEPWRPQRVNLGSGKDYKPGWLNIDILDRAEPDLVLDLGRPQVWPVRAATRFGGDLLLEAGSVRTLYANNVLEHVPDLPTLMGNALALLQLGGVFEIEVPYEKAPTAWQDPTHVRALNEQSWLYYTDWFWYLGWFEHRFEMASSAWLDARVQPCAKEQAAFMRVTLRKIATSPRERTIARTMRADFGGAIDDWQADDAWLGAAGLPQVTAQPGLAAAA